MVCIDVVPQLKQDTFWCSLMFISCYRLTNKEEEMIGSRVPLELRQYSDLLQHIKEPQNCIHCWNTLFEKWHILKAESPETLFLTRRNRSCLSACCQFPLCSAMYFVMRENMMCSVRATWLVKHSNSNQGGVSLRRVKCKFSSYNSDFFPTAALYKITIMTFFPQLHYIKSQFRLYFSQLHV